MVFQIAVGSTELTPKVPAFPSLWMGGYGWSPRGSSPGNVARELKAHCMVIWDDGYPNVLLRADLISIPRDMNQWIRGTLIDEGLLSDTDFMMVSSHTHSGPLVGDIRPNPYILMGLNQADIDAVNGTTNVLIDRLLDLVRATLNKTRTTVTFRYAEASVNIGYNRVEHQTYVMNTVPILVARKANNNRVAILFGAGSHPVSRGNDTTFDCDYPGRAAAQIEASLGVPAMFFQGTCGDQNANEPRGNAQVINLGDKLANAVITKINANTGFTNVTGPIMTRIEEVQLPFAVDTSNPTVVANLRSRYAARLTQFPTDDVNYRHAKVMVDMIDGPGLPTHIAMPIQRWQFNGLTILALAHEVLSGFHVRLKAAYPGKLWIMGYANEVEAYIAPDDVLWNGGYEAGFEWPDNTIAGGGSFAEVYAWPAPLKASPVGVTPAVAGSAEKIIMDCCLDLLNNP
ncbi:hypothetical protein [Umezawaea sp. Da 62-37]|uniref:hypothetical protein n=1 Tax=Umezawaea sp. Da 62-37 TaxID=3075927 RepID=UPI0028F71904|nr:hypothetical protein [Umezawaea sp. Da 62-37]WNV91561.1 hypothetical protein RM788_25870 [Umezawaea sp. Da 62-37]